MKKNINLIRKIKLNYIFIKDFIFFLFLFLSIFSTFTLYSCDSYYSYQRKTQKTPFENIDQIKLPPIIGKLNILVDEGTNFIISDNKTKYIISYNELKNTYKSEIGFYYKGKYIGKEIFIDRNEKTNQLQLISKVELDDYIASVIAAEMGPKFEKEALKAQAVASRTFIIERILSNPNFKIISSTNYQVFDLQKYQDFLVYAKETKDLVLTYNKEIIKTFFHSSSGGILTIPKYEWGGSDLPYYKIKFDRYSENTINWEFKIETNKFIEQLIKLKFLNYKKDIFRISLTNRNEDKRVDQVNIIFTDGTYLIIKGRIFRESFGTTIIKSLLFDVKIENNFIIFTGKGYGHGIGMSQWGANNMAKEGTSFIEILKFYYNDCKISKIIYTN